MTQILLKPKLGTQNLSCCLNVNSSEGVLLLLDMSLKFGVSFKGNKGISRDENIDQTQSTRTLSV